MTEKPGGAPLDEDAADALAAGAPVDRGEDDEHLRLVGPADQLAVLRGLTALRGERERIIFNAAIEALGHQDSGSRIRSTKPRDHRSKDWSAKSASSAAGPRSG